MKASPYAPAERKRGGWGGDGEREEEEGMYLGKELIGQVYDRKGEKEDVNSAR